MKNPIRKSGIVLAIVLILFGAYLYFFNISPASRLPELPELEDMVSVGNLQRLIDDNRPFNLSFLVTTKKIYNGPEKIQGYAVSPTHRNKSGKIILGKDGIVLHENDCVLDSYGIFLFNLPNFGPGRYWVVFDVDGKLLAHNFFLIIEPAPQRLSTDILRVYWFKNLLNVWGIAHRDGMPFQGHLKVELIIGFGDLYHSTISEAIPLQTVDGNFHFKTILERYFLPLFLRIWYNEEENTLIPITHPTGEKKISEMGDSYLASLESIPQAGDIHGLSIKMIAKTNTSPWRLDFPVGNIVRIRAVSPLEKAVVHVLDPITLDLHKSIVKRPKSLRIALSYPFALVDIYARSKTHEYFDYALLLKEDKASAMMELRGEFKAGSDLEVRIDSQKPSEGILIISSANMERDNPDDLLGIRIINPVSSIYYVDEYFLQEAFSGSNSLYSIIWHHDTLGRLYFFDFMPPSRCLRPPHIYSRARRDNDVRSLPKAVASKEAAGIVFFGAFPINTSVRKFITMPAEPGTWKAELIVYYENEYRFDRIEKSFKTYNQTRSK